MEMAEYALDQLKTLNCSCVLWNGSRLLTSSRRGVAPLLAWLDEGQDLSGFVAADKVVGKGAACLYLLLRIKRVHAVVISHPALELLRQHQVCVSYDKLVQTIRNRTDTGPCPIEAAVLDYSEPDQALVRIRKKLKELAQ